MEIKIIFWMIMLLSGFNVTGQPKRAISNDEINYAYSDSIMQAEYRADAPGAVLLIARVGKPAFEKGK